MPIITGTSSLIETWAASSTTREYAGDSKTATGWSPSERPPSQWFNFIIHQIESKINHLLRNGIALWNNSTSYPQGACVTHGLRPWAALNASQNSTPSLTNADWAALATLLDVQSIVPIGCGVWTYAETAPAGFIFFQGQAISRSENPALFAVLGTRFGAGNGSTTFSVPDERGEFFRGWDNGRGVDAGRVLGSTQGDQFRSHAHGGVPFLAGLDSDRGGAPSLFSLDDQGQTAAAGGSETRPRNISGRYMYRLG
jgi:hypothetical protein